MSQNKSYIYYRFVHDLSAFKKLEFIGSKISAQKVRDIIAKANGIEKEYKRTFNLQLYEYNAVGSSNELSSSDAEITGDILANTKCIVKRVLWHEKDTIQHVAEISTEKTPFPNEYLCQTCFNVLVQPVVLRCANKCGKSLCRLCAETQLETHNNNCPFCQQPVKSVLPNKVLADIISQLKIEEFELKQPSVHKLESTTSQQDVENDIKQLKPPDMKSLTFLFPILSEANFNLIRMCQKEIKILSSK